MSRRGLHLGPRLLSDNRCAFRAWAPHTEAIELLLVHPEERLIEMGKAGRGYWTAVANGVGPGSRYFFRLNASEERPDPASRYQPLGVHGPSEVVDPAFDWTDENWRGVTLDRAIFYELHVGTFTQPGTFDAVIEHLDRLRNLGITLVELLPVAQFPGQRNWGYDGVGLFAVQNSYGGPHALMRLVNACHERGLGVAMDVVYNHFGPEGNYLEQFGPYFTSKYGTPWGKAVNFDSAHSEEVRHFFISNALMWVNDYHIDALRLDAIHAIFDQSAYPFLHELSDAVHAAAERLGRTVLVIGESDLNDPKVMRPSAVNGWGLDGTWSDDLHHALHAKLTGEHAGYYADFGTVRHLATALTDGYVYAGDYSHHRKHRHGSPALDVPSRRHIVCSQNHDQVGNRMNGDRLSTLVTFERLKIAAAIILLSPFTPLLFMGEEYGETAPFLYFVHHGDKDLIEAVRKGRAKEFASFQWAGTPPDPQAEETFRRSKLDLTRRQAQAGRALEGFYKELVRLRNDVPAVRSQNRSAQDVTIDAANDSILIQRAVERGGDEIALAANFGKNAWVATAPDGDGPWQAVLDSADVNWCGPGSRVPDSLQPLASFHVQGESAVLLSRTPAKDDT